MTPTRKHPNASTRLATACLFASLLIPGCGYSTGEFLFMTGLFNRPTVKAEFKFSDGPVAIVVDDFQEHCHWPEAKDALAKHIAKELKEHNVVRKLIPQSKTRRLRQTRSNYDELPTREIGELLGAQHVLAIQVEVFRASLDPFEASGAAHMTVTAKVINVLEKKNRSKVRVWPKSPAGKPHFAELSASEVTTEKKRAAILNALTAKLAKKIVRNFYDRKMEDFERP